MPSNLTPLIDLLIAYDAFVQTCDCEVLIRFRKCDPAKWYPARVEDRDEDGRYYVKTHEGSAIFCAAPQQVRTNARQAAAVEA